MAPSWTTELDPVTMKPGRSVAFETLVRNIGLSGPQAVSEQTCIRGLLLSSVIGEREA